MFRLTGLVVLVGAAWGIYDWMANSHFEETDNAYVQGNMVQIVPQTAGTVQTIMADDTDYVKEGQLLVALDPADAKVALDQAKANLAQQEALLTRARQTLARVKPLAKQNAVSQQDRLIHIVRDANGGDFGA